MGLGFWVTAYFWPFSAINEDFSGFLRDSLKKIAAR
jgi:hypothetical protein